jgi:phospholipase C
LCSRAARSDTVTIIKPTRRDLLKTAGTSLAAALAAGCVSEDELSQEEQASIACYFNGKARHAMRPRGAFGPIEHVVVLMMENRSFDHMFGALSIEPGRKDVFGNDLGGEGRTDVNGLTGDESNIDIEGGTVGVWRQDRTYLGDIAHDWDDCHRQADYFGTGTLTNDGFVRRHQDDLMKGSTSACNGKYFGRQACALTNDPMGIYTRAELPIYYALADNYTICDQYYASVLGPTWPNRFFLHLGSSYGQQHNKPVLGKRSIWEVMRDKCLPVENFYCDLPWAHVVGESAISLGTELGDGELFGILQPFHKSQPGPGSFYKSVQADNLGAFTLIDPGFSSGYDDHPPGDVKLGQAFVSYVYHILKSNPVVWNKTLFIITYDEHGSFYDHVTPPGNIAGSPQSFDATPSFRQMGMRIPGIVVGPWVKQRHVSHVQYDHCSILSSLYDRFDLAAEGEGFLNERVKNTPTLEDCIDSNRTKQNDPRPAADIPRLEFSEHEMMEFAREWFPDGQHELAEEVENGRIPREQDHRGYREEVMSEFLEIGEAVGAFDIKI